MKKILLTFMAFFYLAVASGAGVNLHYCMGELADWSLIQDKKHACDFCGMEKKDSAKNGCCKDVEHLAKVDQAQQTNVQIYKFEQSVFVVPQVKALEGYLMPVTKVISQEARSNAPPLGQRTPIFIKNCTYRI